MSDAIERLAKGKTLASLKRSRKNALQKANSIKTRLSSSYPVNFEQLEKNENSLRRHASKINRKVREVERNKLRAERYFEPSRPMFGPHTVGTNSFVTKPKRGGFRHGSRTRRYNKTAIQPVGSLPGTQPRAPFGATPDLNNTTRDFRLYGRVNIQPLPFSNANEGRPVKYKRGVFDKWQSGFKLGKIVIQAELLNSDGRPVTSGMFATPLMVSRHQVKFEPR